MTFRNRIAADNHVVTVFDLDAHRSIVAFPIPTGADVVKFDPGLKRIYAACAADAIAVIQKTTRSISANWRTFPVEPKVHSLRSMPTNIACMHRSKKKVAGRSRECSSTKRSCNAQAEANSSIVTLRSERASAMKTNEVAGYLVGFLLFASPVLAQRSRCADCHFANPTAPARHHLEAWDRSAHGRNDIGCEKCHGGDRNTFEQLLAHRGILNSGTAASPVSWQNLPATCGTCHPGPYVAFQKSAHFALLEKGDKRVPVCTTCHGAVGADRPSPNSLEAECRQCHGPKGIARRPERAEDAKTIYEAINESRERLDVAKALIRHISDKARRARFEAKYAQAEVPLIEAVRAGHEFVYDNLKERLTVARQRIDALLEGLANPDKR